MFFPPHLSFASWEEASEQRRQKTCRFLVEYSVNDVLCAKHLLCVCTHRVTDINGFLLFGPTTPFGRFLYIRVLFVYLLTSGLLYTVQYVYFDMKKSLYAILLCIFFKGAVA
jgi:hypothetical protein